MILIYSANRADHIHHVRQVLTRLRHHLYLKLEKCPSGHPDGPVQSRSCEELASTPNTQDLQRFLGFANFYHCFVANYSELTASLTSLLRHKPKTSSWTTNVVEAFRKLKATFCSAPTLLHPDPSRPFIVEVDTSALGFRAVLSQRGGQPAVLRPCAFFSKKLSPTEQNYDIGNRELLAIKLALKEW